MKEHTQAWCNTGAHEETWLQAISEIGKAQRVRSINDLRPTRHGKDNHIQGVGQAVREFLSRAPAEVWTAASEGRVSNKTIGSLKLTVISKTSERYPMIQLGPLKFQDTANFLKDSLDNLIKSQRKVSPNLQDAFPRMAKLHSGIDLDLLWRKIPFPYTSLTSIETFEQPPKVPIEAYKNNLTGEECSASDYVLVNTVTDKFELTSFGAYHDVYL